MAGKDYIMYGGEKKDVNAVWGFQGPVVPDPERGVAIPVTPQSIERADTRFEPGEVSEADVISGDIAAAEMYLAAQAGPENVQQSGAL